MEVFPSIDLRVLVAVQGVPGLAAGGLRHLIKTRFRPGGVMEKVVLNLAYICFA